MQFVEPRVSVVAPTHHRTQELRRLLESLAEQVLPPSQFEVIVVGDEDDPGESVVTQFAESGRINVQFVFVPNDPWQGRSPSLKRNFGAHLARAEWIAFIDDDCVANPNWLNAALPYFQNAQYGGVEGRKVIPAVSPPTLTYKGLLLFTRPGGYQTANMFYRRALFMEIGGFDTAFPFYLEDTDLAWSVLDRNFDIPHATTAVVSHPVPPPQPMRLLAGARRAILMPYLYKKHPERFQASGMRAIARSHAPYLFVYVVLLVAVVSARLTLAAGCAAVLFILTIAHACRLFWKCRFTAKEVFLTTTLLPIVPIVTLVQLVRGNFRNHVLLLR